MGIFEKFDYKDFTKQKHRILYFIVIGLFAVDVLFSIIALACGGDFFWGLICTIFSIINLLILGYNVLVSFNIKKDFGSTRCKIYIIIYFNIVIFIIIIIYLLVWTVCFAFAIALTFFILLIAIFSLIFMFKHNHGLMVGTLILSAVSIAVAIVTIVLEIRDGGAMKTTA